jgi:hypothetical protein
MHARTLSRPLCALAALAAAASVAPPAAPAEVAARRSIHEPLLERAREGAARKLQRPGCLLLLEDFKDKDGRPLVSSLAEWNRSAVDYLRTTPFRDGSFHPLCRSGGSALVSVVGMRPVFVCPSFRREAQRDPWQAENWLIHEMLHTLGLGENPPSSHEITERVNDRCQ